MFYRDESGAIGGDNWIEIKEGCQMPSMYMADNVQIVVDGVVSCGYYVFPVARSWGGVTGGGWMEYTLKGTEECSPSHWQPMASPPRGINGKA